MGMYLPISHFLPHLFASVRDCPALCFSAYPNFHPLTGAPISFSVIVILAGLNCFAGSRHLVCITRIFTHIVNTSPSSSPSCHFTARKPRTNSDTLCQLNGRHVVFGEVVEGLDLVKAIEKTGTPSGAPKNAVTITSSGVVE